MIEHRLCEKTLTPIQNHCLEALKLRDNAATYVIKNTIIMEGWDKTATTPRCLRALKALERMGIVEQELPHRRMHLNCFQWKLGKITP